MLPNEAEPVAAFLHKAVERYAPAGDQGRRRVLDFGCGGGELVAGLVARGHDAFGCDVKPFWTDSPGDRLRTITANPYRIPFGDGSFDAVVSTSVLEHAQNKEELFREIHRVLVPGGVSMHLYPSKWYLPMEPHIYVPLVNVFWPRCPRWWLGLWARLGIRNEFQQGLPWDRVVDLNDAYCETGLSYWSHARYRRLLRAMFERHEDATAFFMAAGYGGVVQLARRLHLPNALSARLSRTFRMAFFVSWKAKERRLTS